MFRPDFRGYCATDLIAIAVGAHRLFEVWGRFGFELEPTPGLGVLQAEAVGVQHLSCAAIGSVERCIAALLHVAHEAEEVVVGASVQFVAEDRVTCLETLTSPRVRASLEEHGIEVIGYRDL